MKGTYTTYKSWLTAAKKAGAVRLDGDKDIAMAFGADGRGVAEWDGAEGYVYKVKNMIDGKMVFENPKGVYTTYGAWRAAAKKAGAMRFEGDKDIAQAFDGNGRPVAEWDGAEGYIYKTKSMIDGKMIFTNPASRKENYNDFNEWEIDAFRAGATQVVRLGENLFSAIKMKDGSLAKLDKDGFVDMRSRTGQMVRSNSTTVGSWYGERGEINRQLVAKSGKSRPYENPKESPLYVKYLSLMRGEEPFMMGGTKYEYVWAEYPGGIKDIGVYSYAGDLVYSYDSFRKMMNLDRTNPIHSRNPKHRIGISLSKNRRRNPLESGATISDDEDINDRASNMG
jgi:hypothetical protein